MAFRRDKMPKDAIGNYPIGTVYFSYAANAWVRRTERWRNQIIARDEWRYCGRGPCCLWAGHPGRCSM